MQEVTQHPFFEREVPLDVAHYCAENATRAVDLMFNILDGCLSSPRPATRDDCRRLRPALQELHASRLSMLPNFPRRRDR
jgi:hypothetical protein